MTLLEKLHNKYIHCKNSEESKQLTDFFKKYEIGAYQLVENKGIGYYVIGDCYACFMGEIEGKCFDFEAIGLTAIEFSSLFPYNICKILGIRIGQFFCLKNNNLSPFYINPCGYICDKDGELALSEDIVKMINHPELIAFSPTSEEQDILDKAEEIKKRYGL